MVSNRSAEMEDRLVKRFIYLRCFIADKYEIQQNGQNYPEKWTD